MKCSEIWRHYNFSGSFDVVVPFLMGNISTYFNMMIPDFMTKSKKIKALAVTYDPDSASVDSVSTFGIEILGTYARFSQEMYEYVKKTDNYYAHNKGVMQDTSMYEHRLAIHEKLNRRDAVAEQEQNLVTLEYVFRMHVKRMAEFENRVFDEKAYQKVFERSFHSTQTIAGVMAQCSKPASQM